ncbi:MAG: serine/threonine protein kinase [Bacteroidales bacterium]|nr:serine/threonine protein kinase [Bacteroidales bacterium]
MAFLNEYDILKELGKGGFATVYKVRHKQLGYVRAIRILNEIVTDENSEVYKKFLEECRILLRLGNGCHPNIVHIYQPRLIDNKAIVEMDYVDGMDLTHYVKEQQFVPYEEVLKMIRQISSALAYCHEEVYQFCMDRELDHLQDDPEDGSKVLMDASTRRRLIDKYKVIHNDIHSGNIIRRGNGDFILLDFGLAIEGNSVVRSSRRRNGAPEFKPPEKWEDESVLTEQSDIYSFGVVMYEMLAGRVPFVLDVHNSNELQAEHDVMTAHQHITPHPILPLRSEAFGTKFPGQAYQPDYPLWVEQMIMKCLSKNPNDRFYNGRELHDYIEEHLSITQPAPAIDMIREETTVVPSPNSPSGPPRIPPQAKPLESNDSGRQASPELPAKQQPSPDAEKHKRRVWPVILCVLLLLALGAGGYYWYQSRPQQDTFPEQVKIEKLISDFATFTDEDDVEGMAGLYADQIQRYYNERNCTPAYVRKSFRNYNKTFKVSRKKSSVRWETLKISGLHNENTVEFQVCIDFTIDRADKNKNNYFLLEKHFEIDRNYKIVSVYDEQLEKKCVNFDTGEEATRASTKRTTVF